MILTDNINTFTDTAADEQERLVSNASKTITIGGRVKSQADSQRLVITIRERLKKSEFDSLNAILANFTQALYYTPGKILVGKTTASQIEVVAGDLQIEDYAYNGERTFHVTYELEEVIA